MRPGSLLMHIKLHQTILDFCPWKGSVSTERSVSQRALALLIAKVSHEQSVPFRAAAANWQKKSFFLFVSLTLEHPFLDILV